MDKNDVLNELDEATTGFLQAFSSFPQEEVNIIPFEGSWTAGQVAEHILKSASGVLHGLTGPVKSTGRNPEEHVAMLRELFLDFTTKMKGPDFVAPSSEPKDKNAVTGALIAAFSGIGEVVERKDLTETCVAFPMPGLGELTRAELVNFITVHVKRHTHQLQNIAAKLLTAIA